MVALAPSARGAAGAAEPSAGARVMAAPSPAPPAVAIRGLRKSFGRLEVLKGVSLSAADGDVISILGASGSGKSTMLRCINMLEVPDAGEVAIGGEVIRLKQSRHGMEPTDRAQVDRL